MKSHECARSLFGSEMMCHVNSPERIYIALFVFQRICASSSFCALCVRVLKNEHERAWNGVCRPSVISFVLFFLQEDFYAWRDFSFFLRFCWLTQFNWLTALHWLQHVAHFDCLLLLIKDERELERRVFVDHSFARKRWRDVLLSLSPSKVFVLCIYISRQLWF